MTEETKLKVGGQAVLEGVMMRSPHSLAVAVRRANGEIICKESAWRSLWERFRFLRWPFLRGSVVLLESLVNGISALNFSAKVAMADEEAWLLPCSWPCRILPCGWGASWPAAS
jgi:uncharacterized protein YqhQ